MQSGRRLRIARRSRVVGWLHLDGRDLRLTIETTCAGTDRELEVSLEHELA